MTLAFPAIAAATLVGLGVYGQAWAAPIEWDASLGLDVLAGGAAQDAPFNETVFVGRLSAGVAAEQVFANGAKLRLAIGAIAERDHPRHDPRGGRAGDCPPLEPLCPSVEGRSVRGYFSGFTPGGPIADQAGRVALDSAYLALSGGYGEISIGRDEGAAARFSAAPANVLFGGSLVQPSVELTGFGGLAARNDLSGQSFKITAVTPRILGLRLGAGWTPALEAQGVDQGFRRFVDAPAVARPRHIAEFGASFEHSWSTGVETSFSGTFASGGDATGLAAFGRLQSWSFGGALGYKAWRLSAQRLGSNNGWQARQRGYRATTASILYENGPWAAQASGGIGRDNLALTGLSTITLGGRRKLTKSLHFMGGVTGATRAVPDVVGPGLTARRERSLALFTGVSLGL